MKSRTMKATSAGMAGGSVRTIFFGGVDKKFYALDASTGQKRWDFAAKGRIVGSPAFYKNLVFVGAGPDDGKAVEYGQPLFVIE